MVPNWLKLHWQQEEISILKIQSPVKFAPSHDATGANMMCKPVKMVRVYKNQGGFSKSSDSLMCTAKAFHRDNSMSNSWEVLSRSIMTSEKSVDPGNKRNDKLMRLHLSLFSVAFHIRF